MAFVLCQVGRKRAGSPLHGLPLCLKKLHIAFALGILDDAQQLLCRPQLTPLLEKDDPRVLHQGLVPTDPKASSSSDPVNGAYSFHVPERGPL